MADNLVSEVNFSELTSRIMTCCHEVHGELGPGFDKAFYQQALWIELKAAGLSASCNASIDVFYKDTRLGTQQVDLVVEGVLVSLLMKDDVEDSDKAMVLSHLKASGLKAALLVNFGASRVQISRL